MTRWAHQVLPQQARNGHTQSQTAKPPSLGRYLLLGAFCAGSLSLSLWGGDEGISPPQFTLTCILWLSIAFTSNRLKNIYIHLLFETGLCQFTPLNPVAKCTENGLKTEDFSSMHLISHYMRNGFLASAMNGQDHKYWHSNPFKCKCTGKVATFSTS